MPCWLSSPSGKVMIWRHLCRPRRKSSWERDQVMEVRTRVVTILLVLRDAIMEHRVALVDSEVDEAISSIAKLTTHLQRTLVVSVKHLRRRSRMMTTVSSWLAVLSLSHHRRGKIWPKINPSKVIRLFSCRRLTWSKTKTKGKDSRYWEREDLYLGGLKETWKFRIKFDRLLWRERDWSGLTMLNF